LDDIRKIISERGENGEGAFWVNRKYVLNGTIIDYAATYPNRQMRFFAKRSSERFVKKVHERIRLKPGVRHEFLDSTMYIPFEDDLQALRRKWDYQIAVAAAQVSPLSIWQFFGAVFDNAKVSLLWFARLVRDRLFRSGSKMPLKYEMERHRFHLKLTEALWGEVFVNGTRVADRFPVSSVARITRFLISGGTAAIMNLTVLYACTDLLHFWYVYSAGIAFILGLLVSFTLQKFWAFQHADTNRIHVQFAAYTALQIVNLAIDTAGIYLLVEYFGLWYILAQVFLLAVISVWTYFIFNRVLFRQKNHKDGTGSARVDAI
jgi:putative flippase GtrA